MRMKTLCSVLALAVGLPIVTGADAPAPAVAAAPWTPDLGDGSYKNPIIFADYSDPDVTRVGDDFYLV